MELCELKMRESYIFVNNHKKNSENDDEFDSKFIPYFLTQRDNKEVTEIFQ